MQDTINIGIVGLGFGVTVHMPCLEKNARAKVVAVCARNRERAQAVADENSVAGVYTDYSSMLRNADLDAVVIATPDDLHREMVLAAIDAGLHVLCEKPLALNTVDAQEMYARAEAAGVKHMTAYWTRWHPQTRYVRQLVQEGFIGKPLEFHLRWLGGAAFNLDEYRWRFDRKRTIGVVADTGSHLIDYVHWCIADTDRVSASLKSFTEKPSHDNQETSFSNDSATLLLQLRNGAHGTVCASKTALPAGPSAHSFEILLHGDAGSLWVAPTTTEGIWGKTADEEPHEIPLSAGEWDDFSKEEPMMKQLLSTLSDGESFTGAFVQAILNDEPCEPSFLDAVKAQKVIDASVEADRSGGWVSVQ